MRYLDIDKTVFTYRPFPIGLAAPVMEAGLYEALVDSYPERDRFVYLETIGNKYTLSEAYNREAYLSFIQGAPAWRDFHAWVKSRDFLTYILESLSRQHIDLGEFQLGKSARTKLRTLTRLVAGRRHHATLTSRFEFSMLPADGGYVVPHTDLPTKLVTLVVSMTQADQWDQALGGGTDVIQPKQADLTFNQVNKVGAFEDMEVLHTYPFDTNQAVVFVKTFNSWHSVRPMTARGSDAMRRTITINIEAD